MYIKGNFIVTLASRDADSGRGGLDWRFGWNGGTIENVDRVPDDIIRQQGCMIFRSTSGVYGELWGMFADSSTFEGEGEMLIEN